MNQHVGAIQMFAGAIAFLLGVLASTSSQALQDGSGNSDKGVGIQEVGQALSMVDEAQRVPERYALVIGAGEFRDGTIPALPQCANDANIFYDTLLDPRHGLMKEEQVRILVGPQATRANIMKELGSLAARVGEHDLAVVFFSGHGMVDRQSRGYWVTHDTQNENLRATALSNVEILDLLNDIDTSRLVVFVDACHAAATADLATKGRVDESKLYPTFDGEGRVRLASCDTDELSLVIDAEKNPDHPGKGFSVYSWHLTQGMRGEADSDGDGVVTVMELGVHLSARVPETARSLNGRMTPIQQGKLGGNYLFTVNADRLVRRWEEAESAVQLREERVRGIRELTLNEMITIEQGREGLRLLNAPPSDLSVEDRAVLGEYLSLLAGEIKPGQLARAIELLSAASPMAQPEEMSRDSDPPPSEADRPLSAIDPPVPEPDVPSPSASASPSPVNAVNGVTKEVITQAQLDWARHLGLEGPVVENDIGMKFVVIPPGTFMMGSPDDEPDRGDDENRHRETIAAAFLLGQTEVTQGQWKRVMKTEPWKGEDYVKVGDSYPATYVNWEDASEFCEKLGAVDGKSYRLPTEAEWEYACRGGTTTAYSYGDDPDDLGRFAWFDGSAWDVDEKYAHQVGQKLANPLGLRDMHGNVWEWCSDWYTDGSLRMNRGGSWDFLPRLCRSAYRFRNLPSYLNNDLGFRVASSPWSGK